MKKIRVLLLAMMFLISCFGTALSESYAEVTFQKSQSYELADLVDIFALPLNSSEPDWVSIRYAENFKYLYKVENITQNKKQTNFRFGGVIGLTFNGNGAKKSTQYWENGILKEAVDETGFTTNATFSCPVWNGYDHLNVGINLPPSKVANLMHTPPNGTLEDIFTRYFNDRDMKVSTLETYSIKYREAKYLLMITPIEKDPIYLVLSGWSGSGGALGHIDLDLFFNLKKAKLYLVK